MNNKRICFIIGSLAGGGAERSILTLTHQLIRSDVNVDIIVLKNKVEYEVNEIQCNIHFLSETSYLSKNPIINFYLFRKRIKKKIREFESSGTFDMFVSTLFLADRLVRTLNLRNVYFYIQNMQSANYLNQPWFKKVIYKYTYDNENLLVVSEGLKSDLLENIPIHPKQLETIFNSFDVEDIKRQCEDKISIKDPFVLHIGKFMDQKRHDILLKAYSQSGIKHKLVLMGSGFDEGSKVVKDVHFLIDKLNLTEKVIIVGFDSNPYKYLSKAKLFILSSDYEGFGNVLVESLICGTITVSTDCVSGPAEILVDELSDFLSPVGDVDGLAYNINKALSSNIKISESHYKRFSSEYIVQKFLNKL